MDVERKNHVGHSDPPVVFLAWQDPVSRAWFPIGRLSHDPDGIYRFVYTWGFEDAARQTELTPLIGFSRADRVYESSKLFPMFANRIMSRSRTDYASYVQRLGLPESTSPLTLLARSTGRRSTDSFEMFPFPLREGPDGPRYDIDFFIHGMRHMPEAALARAERLEPKERVFLLSDQQNRDDPHAVAIRSHHDRFLLGYIPRYYARDVAALLRHEPDLEVRVERVNPAPAPVQQRVLLHLDAPWTVPGQPFEAQAYQPLANGA